MLVVHTNEDGYSRLALHDLALRAPSASRAAGRRDDRTARGLAGRQPPGLRVLVASADLGRVAPRDRRIEQLTRSPTTIPEDALVAPTLHRFASFDAEPIRTSPFTRRRAAPPVILEIHGGPEAQRRPTWMPVVQHLVAQGFAVVQPQRPWIDRLREALRASRRRPPAPRHRPRRRDTPRSTARGRPARRRQDRALWRVVRRVHGARLPRLRAGALGRRGRDRADLQLRRHLPARHVGVPSRLPASGSTARSAYDLEFLVEPRRSRTSTGSARRSS